MANFSQTEVSPVQSFTTVQQGVEGPRPFLAEGLTNIFRQVGEMGASRTEDKNAIFLSEFTSQQLAIADAYAQNPSFGREEALTRLRANFNSAQQASPAMLNDLLKVQSSIMGTAGLGQIISEGTPEDQDRERLRSSLVDSGVISPNATYEEEEIGITNFRMYEEAKRRFQTQMDTISLSNASEEIKNKQAETAARDWLKESSPFKLQEFTAQAETIARSVGLNGVTQADALQKLDQLWAATNAEFAGPLSEAGGFGADLIVPYKMTYENMQKVISGEYDTAAAKAEVDRISAINQVILLQDPELAGFAASSSIFPNLPLDQVTGATNAATRVLQENSTIGTDPARIFSRTSQGAVKTYYDWLKTTIRQRDLGDDTREELVTNLNKIFQGVEEGAAALTKDPVLAKSTMDFFSSQEFYKLLQENPEIASGESYDIAVDILKRDYYDEVMGMVEREFLSNGVISIEEKAGVDVSGAMNTLSETPTPEAVSYRSTDSGMEFFAVDPNNPAAVLKAAELNKNLKPVINRSVRAFSHINGSTDYRATWESSAEAILGAGVMGDQNIEVEDFTKGSQTIGDVSFDPIPVRGFKENVSTTSGFLSGLGLSNAQVAGVLGNLIVESGDKNLNPLASGDNGNAFGIAQWNGPRMESLKSWAEENGKDVNTLETQLEYLAYELQNSESKAFRKIKEAKTAEEAALAFSKYFERPGTPLNDRRVSAAKEVAFGMLPSQDYPSEEAAIADIESGKLKEGDIVTIGDKTFRVGG